MKLSRIILFAFFLIFLVPNAFSAVIHGTVYNYDLSVLKDVVVEVDSVPKQIYVAKDGTYSFTLGIGDYIIKARYEDNYKKYSFEQAIIIKDEGDYIFDIILFPDVTDEITIDNGEQTEETNKNNLIKNLIIIFAIILILFSIFLFWFFFIFSKSKNKKSTILEDDIKDDIIKFIKKEGGRTTQKDIRRNFPFSEAKISLAITELEHKQLIEKIKKGRGNIIVLKSSA